MKARPIYAFVLILVFALILTGCAFEDEAHIGVYDCAAISLDGESFDVKELYPEGLELELMSCGQAWLSVNGERVYGRWSAEGDSFTLDINGELSEGTLEGGVCVLRLAGTALEHVLLREGAELPTVQTGEQSGAEPSERQLFWNGDWYGLWTIENATGQWLDQSGQSFDCFARFEIGDDNTGKMIFWDELQSAVEPVAIVELLISDSAEETVSGVAVSTGGFFLDAAVEETQWSVDPSAGSYDSMFFVDKAHYEGEDGSFDYSIRLRPWGRTWEDVQTTSPELLPYFYFDWYLPQLASGMTMPDEFQTPEKSIVRDIWVEAENESDI